jgi:hypothetical protein
MTNEIVFSYALDLKSFKSLSTLRGLVYIEALGGLANLEYQGKVEIFPP